jgi:hypothetical protein
MKYTLMIVLLVLCVLFGLGALKQACESYTRKSTPPIPISDPNAYKRRTDICRSYYDGDKRNSESFTESNGEVIS